MAVDVQRKLEVLSTLVAKALQISSEELQAGLVRATEADIPAIMALRRTGFHLDENQDLAIMRWKYFSYSEDTSDFFVLRVAGRIIAELGALPLSLHVDGDILDGVMLGDIVVDPAYANIGIGGWMLVYLQTRHPVVMTMRGNKHSVSMLKRLFHSVHCRHHLKYLFSSRAYFAVRQWPRWLARAVDLLGFSLLRFYKLHRLPRLPAEYRVVFSDDSGYITSYLDNTAEAFRPQQHLRRTTDFFRWRYDTNPVSQFRHLQLLHGDQMVGYAVLKMVHKPDYHGGYLMDWHLRDEHSGACPLPVLFAEVLRMAHAEKLDYVSVMASETQSVNALAAIGFSVRDVESGLYIHANTHSDTLYSADDWFVSYADTEEVL